MQISNFLNAIQKEIGGKVFTIYKTLKLPEAGEVEVIEMYDSDGQETGELDEVRVYFKGDSSVGEGDLEFMSFDPKGVFKKLSDYDDMNEDLGLDEIKKSIERNVHLLLEATTAGVEENEAFSTELYKICNNKDIWPLFVSFYVYNNDVRVKVQTGWDSRNTNNLFEYRMSKEEALTSAATLQKDLLQLKNSIQSVIEKYSIN